MCELCNGLKEIRRARIITDANQKFEGQVCVECRDGRELCLACNLVLPAHGGHCPAGPDAAGSLD